MLDGGQGKFQWGQPVLAQADLINDGSYPDACENEILVKSGMKGEVVQTGMHEESNTPVYLVEFQNGKVVGCLETELAAA